MHPTDDDMRARLERIRGLVDEALAADTTGKPNLLRVALSQIERAATLPDWRL